MRFVDFKRGRLVEDSWFPEWGRGKILSRVGRKLRVRMPRCPEADEDGVVVYDSPHARLFLRLVPR